MPTRCRAPLPADAGGAFVTSQTQIPRALRSTVCFADGIFVNGAGPLMPTRCRAPLPADAGGAFVNGLRKTNVCFRSRLFFAALIISYSPKLLSVNVFPSVIHHSTGKICHLISHTPQITTDDHALSASFTIEYGHFPHNLSHPYDPRTHHRAIIFTSADPLFFILPRTPEINNTFCTRPISLHRSNSQ